MLGVHLTQVFTLPSVPSEPFSTDATVECSGPVADCIAGLADWIGQLGDWAKGLADWISEQVRTNGAITSALHVWIVIWAMDLINTLWKLPKAPRTQSDRPFA